MVADAGTLSRAPAAARRMALAANELLESLSAAQRRQASFTFAGAERYEWNYTPVDRNGLRLKDLSSGQRRAALALLASGLSARGAEQAKLIIAHEAILSEWERLQQLELHWKRDPELYVFSVFGEPGGEAPWAWRVGGHHLGLHFTIVDRELISPLPLFFGANPAEVRHGPHIDKRILAAEEDLARTLLGSLDGAQKAVAIVESVAPDDILTKNYRVADPSLPLRGIVFAALSGQQRELAVRLVRHYVERSADDLANNEWRRIETAGLDGVTFAWAGPEERGQGHYYALVGPTFAIEYDNTQNGANHIHSVWRSFAGDWGEDLLAAHYAASAHR